MARKNPRRNISRIETVSSAGNLNCGWEVRLQRRGRRFEKFFADNAFGGKRGALQKAKDYRDQLDASLKSYTVRELARRPSIRNSSGLVGVRQTSQTETRGDYEYTYYFWVAQWTDGAGKRKTRSFSCHKYGEEEAKRLAVQARNQGVAKAKREI